MCRESSLIQVLRLSQLMTLPSSLSAPMCIWVPSKPKQARHFEMVVKVWKVSQESWAIVTMELLLVDHVPLKLHGLRGIFCAVGLLLSAFVCCTTTKCDSGSRVASFCFMFPSEDTYVRFEDDVGCVVVMSRNLLVTGFAGAPAWCFLMFLVRAIFWCAGEGDCGRHVEALVRVTVLLNVFLLLFAIRSSLVVSTSSLRVLEWRCRLLRRRCLTGSRTLRGFLLGASELADSVAEWDTTSPARSATIRVHVSPSLQTMPSPSPCNVPV